MTSKERMIAAMSHGVPDCVPVSPDMSNMIPAKLTGKPFWEIYLYSDPPLGEAYLQAVERFGFDGWYPYGELDAAMSGHPLTGARIPVFGLSLAVEELHIEFMEQSAEKLVIRASLDSPVGELESIVMLPASQPPWFVSKPIKNLKDDWPRLRWFFENEWVYGSELPDYDHVGSRAVYGLNIDLPVDWWMSVRHGGIEAFAYDMADNPELMDEIFACYRRFALHKLEAQLRARPDEILFSGSTSSLSLISPAIYERVNLPFLREATAMCRRAEVISHQHTCGRSRWIVETSYRDTDLDVVEPLEPPPGGDVELAEVKKKFGEKLCLKGNINTYNTMRLGSVTDVEEAVKRCIDHAAEGGGFILSTGDQLPFDTPSENIEAMVRIAREYGKY